MCIQCGSIIGGLGTQVRNLECVKVPVTVLHFVFPLIWKILAFTMRLRANRSAKLCEASDIRTGCTCTSKYKRAGPTFGSAAMDSCTLATQIHGAFFFSLFFFSLIIMNAQLIKFVVNLSPVYFEPLTHVEHSGRCSHEISRHLLP